MSTEEITREPELLESEEYLTFLESQGKPRIGNDQKRNTVIKIYATFIKGRNEITSVPSCMDNSSTRKKLFDLVLEFRGLTTKEIGKEAMMNLFGTDEEILALYNHFPTTS